MIVTDVDKKHPLDAGLAGPAPVHVASASSSHSVQFDVLPPPPDGEAPKYTERAFENVYIPPGGEEPPPEFTPYEAEFFISGREVVSHDTHLNEDGESFAPCVKHWQNLGPKRPADSALHQAKHCIASCWPNLRHHRSTACICEVPIQNTEHGS